ncbi:MAG: hypothetical protein H7832_12365 [Magnetococcus sp. DMHC-6]
MHKKIPLIAFFSLLLTGCATDEAIVDQTTNETINETTPPKISGTSQQSKMIGLTRADLIAQYGQPTQTMDATLTGGPQTEAYVYAPKSGSSNDCYDTFTILEKTGEIVNYFCR